MTEISFQNENDHSREKDHHQHFDKFTDRVFYFSNIFIKTTIRMLHIQNLKIK